jgi:hypothetical protein
VGGAHVLIGAVGCGGRASGQHGAEAVAAGRRTVGSAIPPLPGRAASPTPRRRGGGAVGLEEDGEAEVRVRCVLFGGRFD